MVWGMSIPSNFGEFWPDGDFEGVDQAGNECWANRLRLHYLKQPEVEQRRLLDFGANHPGYGAGNYASFIHGKYTRELGTLGTPGIPPFTPVQVHEAPESFVTLKTYKSLGSLIALNSRILAVDEPLKIIIDRLEPSIHQFFPMEIRMPKGQIYPKKYFSLVIGQYFDSFSEAQSNTASWKEDGEYYRTAVEGKRALNELAFFESVFGGAHLWRERRYSEWLTFFSDELREEILKAGLSIPKHYRLREV
jgi:hypothetical protein